LASLRKRPIIDLKEALAVKDDFEATTLELDA
jgi:hypothetical protein